MGQLKTDFYLARIPLLSKNIGEGKMALPNMRQVYIFLGMILFFNIKLSIQECSQHDLQRPYPHDLQRPVKNNNIIIIFIFAYETFWMKQDVQLKMNILFKSDLFLIFLF